MSTNNLLLSPYIWGNYPASSSVCAQVFLSHSREWPTWTLNFLYIYLDTSTLTLLSCSSFPLAVSSSYEYTGVYFTTAIPDGMYHIKSPRILALKGPETILFKLQRSVVMRMNLFNSYPMLLFEHTIIWQQWSTLSLGSTIIPSPPR